MRKSSSIFPLLFFLIIPFTSFSQKIDFSPFIGPNLNFNSVFFSKNNKVIIPNSDPVVYSVKGVGINKWSVLYSGSFHVAFTNKNNFGLQTGARLAKVINGFISDEELPNAFIHRGGLALRSTKIELPIHFVFDLYKSEQSDKNLHSPKYVRLFFGPVFSFGINSKYEIIEFNRVLEFDGTLLSTYESDISIEKSWRGIEVGLNINQSIKNYISLGLLYQYGISPLAHVNYTGSVAYSSKTTGISEESIGHVSLKGSNLMLQIGINPIILKK